MSLQLEYRADLRLPVDLDGLTPDWARGKTAVEIAHREVWLGNQSVPLAELFAISGDPTDGAIIFSGDTSHVHSIGAGLTDGTIRVEGSVGRHAGAAMTGGTLLIAGNAGDWLGCQMRGGRIHVRGDAGD